MNEWISVKERLPEIDWKKEKGAQYGCTHMDGLKSPTGCRCRSRRRRNDFDL